MSSSAVMTAQYFVPAVSSGAGLSRPHCSSTRVFVTFTLGVVPPVSWTLRASSVPPCGSRIIAVSAGNRPLVSCTFSMPAPKCMRSCRSSSCRSLLGTVLMNRHQSPWNSVQ
jgi:hypothetical protein